MSESPEAFMLHALALAERGRGAVEPNPLVGAVLVRDGEIVGEGWHAQFGGPHAEVHALHVADARARGATLYVTLEPCCHHGKTPPCTEALLRAGVAAVHAAWQDPFPQVAGHGATQLRAAGIPVEFGLCAAQAQEQNAPYLKLLRSRRPFVHAKWACTLDGKICTQTGASKWLSNATSRAHAHALRGRMDAIVVGLGTVLADDPLLTARPPGPRQATRIVLDTHARLPLTSQLLKTARDVPTLVATCLPVETPVCRALLATGCEVLTLGAVAGRPSVAELLDELGRRRFSNVLVEGGSAVLGSFLDADEIDACHVYLTPLLVGSESARSPVAGVGRARLEQALRLPKLSAESLAGDVYVHGQRESSTWA